MVIRNFTAGGDYVSVIARTEPIEHGETPVFDLTIGTSYAEMTHEGLSYKELIEVCEDIRKELEEVACYWGDTGRELSKFNEAWSKKEASE